MLAPISNFLYNIVDNLFVACITNSTRIVAVNRNLHLQILQAIKTESIYEYVYTYLIYQNNAAALAMSVNVYNSHSLIKILFYDRSHNSKTSDYFIDSVSIREILYAKLSTVLS